MIIPKPFYFLRHGQTDSNAKRQFCGISDIPLNAVGVQQAKAAALHMQNLPISAIFASNLLRAKQTATIVNTYLNKEIHIVKDLQECNFGILEGKVVTAARQELISTWLNGSIISNLELLSDFTSRVVQSVNSCLRAAATPLLVSHSMFALILLQQLQYHKPRLPDNCGLMYFDPSSYGRWSITYHN